MKRCCDCGSRVQSKYSRWCDDCGRVRSERAEVLEGYKIPLESEPSLPKRGRGKPRIVGDEPDDATIEKKNLRSPKTRTCFRCERELPLTSEFFGRDRRRVGGLAIYCIWCRREIRRESYWRHRDEQLEKKQTPKYRYRAYLNGAKKRDMEWWLTFDQFMTFWQKPCVYCGAEIETIGIDRINPLEGYVLENLVPCCSFCNIMKRNMNADVFLLHVVSIAKHMRTRANLERVLRR